MTLMGADWTTLGVLRLLVTRPHLTQRELASSLGVSLGKVNHCMRALIAKGFVKVENYRKSSNKLAYLYLLTPAGETEKASLTRQFLACKEKEYEVLKRADEPSIAQDESVSLLWMIAVLVRDRRVMLAFTAAGMILGIALALLRPKAYTSVFSFLPQTGQEQTPGGLANLAGQFGISLGSFGSLLQSPQFYADLLVTREVLTPIAQDSFDVWGGATTRVPLPEFLHVRGKDAPAVLENTIRALRRDVISAPIASRTTGIVTVRVRTRSARASQEIAERLLDGLNHFNLVARQSQAREERRFTEERLAEARVSLRTGEDSLERFLTSNREFALSPALTFERDRLEREVVFEQQIVTSLAQRYEEDRIREVRETPVITVIDRPNLAALPDRRLRGVILGLGMVAGIFVGVLTVMARDAWTWEKTSGSNAALDLLAGEWKRMRGVAAS